MTKSINFSSICDVLVPHLYFASPIGFFLIVPMGELRMLVHLIIMLSDEL